MQIRFVLLVVLDIPDGQHMVECIRKMLIRINADEEFLAILASYVSAEPENSIEENEND